MGRGHTHSFVCVVPTAAPCLPAAAASCGSFLPSGGTAKWGFVSSARMPELSVPRKERWGGLPSLASPRDERRTPSGTALPQRLSRVPTVTSVNALGDGAQKRHRRLQRGAPTPAVGGGAGLQEGSVPVP